MVSGLKFLNEVFFFSGEIIFDGIVNLLSSG